MSFYSPIDRLAQNLPRPKGTGAEFMTELSKMPGYKTQEAEDRGLQALVNLPKMERAQFMEALKRKRPVVPEVDVLGEEVSPLQRQARVERAALTDFGIPYEELNDLDRRDLHKYADKKGSYHEQWTLPGGSNYREILLKHPRGEFKGVESHFGGEPNILASVRAKDRTGPNGEKILHIEELQSDWHQQGREHGYKTPKIEARRKELEKLVAPYYAGHSAIPNELRQEIESLPSMAAVPDAPFKKNWHEMALKKMIHHAAANGYDSIAITPGAEQADRYGLAKHIDSLEYYPDTNNLVGMKGNKNPFFETVAPEKLSEYVGQGVANRLLAQPLKKAKRLGETQGHFISGEDIKVGGEGMKGFYDKIVPNFLNQFGKKYGAKVGRIQVPTDTTMDRGPEGNLMVPRHTQNYAEVHHFPITPEMREDVVKNGVPLYAEGGAVKPIGYTKEQVTVSPNLDAMRYEMESVKRYTKKAK